MNIHKVVVPLMVCVAAITSLTGCVGGQGPACGASANDKLDFYSNCKPQEYFADLSTELGIVILGQPVEIVDTSWVGAAALGSKCVVTISRGEGLEMYNIFIEGRFSDERLAIVNEITSADMVAVIDENRSACA